MPNTDRSNQVPIYFYWQQQKKEEKSFYTTQHLYNKPLLFNIPLRAKNSLCKLYFLVLFQSSQICVALAADLV